VVGLSDPLEYYPRRCGYLWRLAALAIASVLPRTPESERDTILTVVTVTVLSIIAMIAYPLFVTVLPDHIQAGIFLGAPSMTWHKW